IVDSYAGILVMQVLTAGIERVKNLISEILAELLDPGAIIEKSDADVRALEGLEPSSRLLSGKLPAGPVRITENGLEFFVNAVDGQKTGFFLDQRDNRSI